MVVWLTGLSASGKTTIARQLLQLWQQTRRDVVLLDGESLRAVLDGPSAAREFSLEVRAIREERAAELCAMLDRQGFDVICALNSTSQAVRDRNRQRFTCYFEVYVAAPLDVCVLRDPEGLYLRALRGDTCGVVGVDLPLDPPRSPDLVVDNGHPSNDPANLAQRILASAHRKQRQSLARSPRAGSATAGVRT